MGKDPSPGLTVLSVNSRQPPGRRPHPVSFTGPGGVRLAGEGLGDPDQSPVLFLHGAGQTRHAWGAAAETLAGAGWYTIALDLRGHGDSDWPDADGYTVDAFAGDVLAVIDALGEPPAVVGASLGGLAALAAQGATTRQLFRALVLVDVTPRLEPAGVGRVVGFMAAHPEGFASLDEAAAAVARHLPDRAPRKDMTGLSRVLRQAPDGRYRWRWDPRLLGAIGDLAGGDPETITHRTDEIAALLTQAARRVQVPTLIIRGALSDVISGEGVAEFLEAVPHADSVEIDGAGHMVAGDRNDAFRTAVVAFLNELPPAKGSPP
jgi:pimeloyl-ACP methyl ester carboxylesterase